MSIATAWRRQSCGYSALNLTYMCIQNFPEVGIAGVGGFCMKMALPPMYAKRLLGDHACIVELCE